MMIMTTLLAVVAGFVLFQLSKAPGKALKPIRIRTEEEQRRRRR